MRFVITTLLAVAIPTSWAWALTSTTVSFQQDVNGYTDVAEMRISFDWNSTANPINSDNTRDGSNGLLVGNYLIDSFQADDPITPAVEDSNDEQELIKFGGIIGNGAGQIPLGATILDAQMTYKTYDTGTTPPSPGAWGVAALNQPFTTATRYADFPSSNPNPLLPYRGAWFEDGADQAIGHPYATRPVGAFAGPQSAGPPPTGTNNLGGVANADVFAVVQRWADGVENHGMVVQGGFTGQTNGWGFFTSGASVIENRPKLSVTYTTSPIGKKTFQRDLNGYNGDTLARLDSGADLNNSGDDVTLDGSTLTGAYYMDGATSTGGILLDLIKFTNVFGAGANQSPADKPVAKAWLVLTTGLNDDNRSPGPFSVHPMLRDWDATPATTYTNFGATAGLQEADGDIGPAADTNYGAINGGESWFDVTSYLEAVRTNPSQDKGLAILPGTTDGWAIMMNGATDTTIRPRLVVYSDLTTTPAGVLGDYNNNGVVDAADYVLWRNGGSLQNEGVTTGSNTPEDYTYWRSRFGATTGTGAGLEGGAVPEPATWLIGLIAALLLAIPTRGRCS